MQVNRITWRSIYDVKGLNGDISYNGNAGAEILALLSQPAMPFLKKEDKQARRAPRARDLFGLQRRTGRTWRRYRGVRQSATWKKVDEAFWTKFQAVSSGQETAVKSCYAS